MSKEKSLKYIGVFFTGFGIIYFISSFIFTNTDLMIIGLLSMILGELIDLPYRIKNHD